MTATRLSRSSACARPAAKERAGNLLGRAEKAKARAARPPYSSACLSPASRVGAPGTALRSGLSARKSAADAKGHRVCARRPSPKRATRTYSKNV